MEHTLPALPYAQDALAPHISKETFEYHYGKHHQAYVTNLNNLIKGTDFENASLEDIIKKSSGGVYNNSAQVWNHTFFWNSMKPLRPERNWIVLAGYRIESDIPFYDISKYASQDVLKELLWQYNDIVCANNTNLTRETSALNIKSPNGQPLRWVQSLDIVYPAHPSHKVPLINDNCADMKRSQNRWSIGFMVRGCSISTTDHNYSPIWLSYYKWLDGYKYHSIDAFCGAHAALAAVRFFYANSDRFNIDTDHIGFIGHSKAQYGVTVLSDPNLTNACERSHYQDPNSPWPEQPNEGYPTRICVGYQGSGSGAYCPNLITPEYVPTFVGQGALDDNKGNIPQFAVFCNALKKQHVKHYLGLLMPEIPHSMPKGWNPALNRDNYSIFVEFMDRYLWANPEWPLVFAGSNQTVIAGTGCINLSGKATAGGTPLKSLHWDKIKGPEVNIFDADTLHPKIINPASGVYLIRLRATDSVGKCGFAVVQITVMDPG